MLKFFNFIEKKLVTINDFIVTQFHKRRFKKFGKGSIIKSNCIINNAYNIEVGNNVIINEGVWLNGRNKPRKDKKPTLVIGDNCNIGRFSHINAFEDVLIEENVLIAENVFLGDADHRVTDPDISIINQGHVLKPGTIIGTGSFIARNAVLSGGVKLGKNCLVGANSVLKKRTYKNNTLIYGNPGKVVNNYNSKMNLFNY